MDFKVGDKIRVLMYQYAGRCGVIDKIDDIHGEYPIGVKLSIDGLLRWFRLDEIEKA